MSRTTDPDILDAVVVGAGWAGLGVSHGLKRQACVIASLERGRIGETWRTQRWDSFRMNTPNVQTVMPGDRYDGPDPDGVLTRDEFVALLEDFAKRNGLPVEPDSQVTELARGKRTVAYRLTTPRGTLRARNVMVASGSLNRPVRPPWAASAAARSAPDRRFRVPQRGRPPRRGGAGGRKRPIRWPDSRGPGEAGRTVFLATGRVGRLPRRYRGRDISIWLVESGLFDVPRKEFVQPSGRVAGRPLLGAVHTISLQSLSAQGVVLLGRLTGTADGHLAFAGDLDENIRFADEFSASARRQIDEYIARAGIDAPEAEPDPAEIVAARLPNPPIRSLDLARSGITTVIWCTGFQGDFSWVRLPGVLDPKGQPVHEDGVAALPGIYFAGMDFATTRKSGTILAIAEEAPRIVKRIADVVDGRPARPSPAGKQYARRLSPSCCLTRPRHGSCLPWADRSASARR